MTHDLILLFATISITATLFGVADLLMTWWDQR